MPAAPIVTLLLGAALAGPRPVDDVWVRIDSRQDRDTVAELGLGFAEGVDGAWVRYHGEAGAAEALLRSGLTWRRADGRLEARRDSGYPSPSEVVESLDALAASHPDLVERVDIGTSVEGRLLAGVRITATERPRASWRVLGAHHGDEQSSSQLALEVARELVASYGMDPDRTALLDSDEIWVVPMVNPDGVAADSRYNARSVDLNRNYDYLWSADEFRPGSAPFSEPETRAIRALSSWTSFAAGLSLHSGATNIGWVWNHTTEPTPDDDILRAMAGAYDDACDQDGFWTTNGADWYITNGDTNDWSYGAWGALDYTVEVSLIKTPTIADLEGVLAAHVPAVERFVGWQAVAAGQVVDADSGLGIPATLTSIEDGWPLVTGPEGRFARPMDPSTARWSVVVRAPGYDEVIEDIDIGGPVRIPLQAASLATLRPTPGLLSKGTSGEFTLPVQADRVVLSRSGEGPVSASAVGEHWQVDLSHLQPGTWDLVVDGAVAPRSLAIGEVDDVVRIFSTQLSPHQLTVNGEGFGAGTRAWALWGAARAPAPLPLLAESPDTLVFDAAILDGATGFIDLTVLSLGRQLTVLDLTGEAVVDTDPPPDTGPTLADDDSGSLPDRSPRADGGTVPGCACTSSAPPASLPVTSPLLVFAAWRRRRLHPRDP